MSKKFSQFNQAIAPDFNEELVGLQDGDNMRTKFSWRGPFDASVNQYPSTNGRGPSGAIFSGDSWYASVGGTISGITVNAGDLIICLVSTPGQTASNWKISKSAADAWPLAGTADLTGNVTIDGNNFDLIFGSTNRLDSFQVFSDGGITLNDDDGANSIDIDIGGSSGFNVVSSQDIFFQMNDGVVDVTMSLTNAGGEGEVLFQSDGSVIFLSDDGVDTSSITLGPTDLDLVVAGGTLSVDGGPAVFFGGDGFFFPYAKVDSFNIYSTNGIYFDDDNTFLLSTPYVDIRSLDLSLGYGESVIKKQRQYSTLVDNSGGGTPLDTNVDFDLFGSDQNVSASILFHISAISSDGAVPFGGTVLALIYRDGSANPTLYSEDPRLQGDATANATVSTNGANVRLTLTTPAGVAFRWGVWHETNFTKYT